MPAPRPGAAPIVFFDGLCGLCDRLVQWLARADRRGRLRFAPLRGETARRILGDMLKAGRDDAFDSLVLVDGRGTALRSEAVLRALASLGGPWRLVLLLRLVPRPLRDGLYSAVAARRTRGFGRRSACRIPATAERDRYLP
jgi:predicted DCC family thiol-disulfide oxidoreductase YuxK